MLKKYLVQAILVAWLGGLLSCAGGNGPVSPPDGNFPAGGVPPGYRAGDVILRDVEVTLAPTTKVFTHDEDVFLLAITDFGARYSFSANSPTAKTVHAGDVIAGVKGDGFLRKVVSIDLSEPGLIIFVTKPAAMVEAVSSANFEITHKLTPAGVREVSSADAVDGEGASRIGAANPEHFYIQLKDLVVFDKDKNPYTVFDQATLSGFIDLEPVFNVSVVIDEGVVNDFEFRVDAKLDSDLTVKVGGGAGFVDERAKIATYYFNPVVFIAEELPVVLTPKLQVYAGITAAVGSTTITTVTLDYSYTSGLDYTGGELSPISLCATSNGCGSIKADDPCNVQGYEAPLLDFYMYGQPGPKAHTEVTTSLNCDLDADPDWQVSTDMHVTVGGMVDVPTVFSIDLTWPDPVVQDHQDLCSGNVVGSEFKLPTAVAVVEGVPPFNIDTPITFDGTGSHDNDEEGVAIVSWAWDWGGGNGLEDPMATGITTHVYGKPGNYYVQLRVTDDEGEVGLLDELLKVSVIDPSAPPIPGPPDSEVPITFNVTPDSEHPSFIVANISALLDGSNPLNDLTHDNFFLVEDGLRREDYGVEQITEGTYTAGADIAFIMDVTGSMHQAIYGVQESVKAFAEYVRSQNLDVRFAGIQFRDDLYPPFDFTEDVDVFKGWVSGLEADGGDDTPENDVDAIMQANDELSWKKGSQRIMVLITDSGTHELGDGTPFSHYTVDQVCDTLVTNGYVVHSIQPYNVTEGIHVAVFSEATGGLHYDVPQSGIFDLTDMPLGEVIAAGYLMAWLDPNPGVETSHEVRIGVFRTMAERDANKPWRDHTGFYPY